jgi:hypothetical protein
MGCIECKRLKMAGKSRRRGNQNGPEKKNTVKMAGRRWHEKAKCTSNLNGQNTNPLRDTVCLARTPACIPMYTVFGEPA